MSDKFLLSLMSGAFAEARLSLRFEAKGIQHVKRYVAWIDIMGAGAAMRRSLVESSAKIGKFNAAIFNATSDLPEPRRVTVHSMTDGAYVVADSAENLQRVLALIMMHLARAFLEASNDNKFVVRCAVAYGNVVPSDEMQNRLYANEQIAGLDATLLRNVMLGGPFAQAYAAEGCAAPFGVYVDSSAIKDGTFSEENIWRWWLPSSEMRERFIFEFRTSLIRYFNGIETHYYRHMVPSCKILEYKAKIKSYFQRDYRIKISELPLSESDASDDSSSESLPY